MHIPINDSNMLVFLTQARSKQLTLETYLNDLLGQLASKIEKTPNFRISLDDKIALAEWVLTRAFEQFDSENIALAWTGGKDSTLILWLTLGVCKRMGRALPKIMLIDEGEMFEEVIQFTRDLARQWKFEYLVVRNEDVLKQVGSELAKSKQGVVEVKRLNARNRQELKRLGFSDATFPFEPESLVGNHLMKTVVQNEYIETHHIAAMITGIRWDEQEARSQEQFFSDRGGELTPTHLRIHPILQFTEADIWEVHHQHAIPYCSLYEQGYRSLGAKVSTTKTSNTPAWKQDLQKTSERGGRNQDKEEIMKRLRDLGYM